ncbi:MAG: hypothetical protein IMZ55_17650 [Acidobacteria bacterium]|nr:hypothetical protein [Acidobacteriota bacterium]
MSSTALTVQDRIAWSQALAGSAMIPAQYRAHPENLFYAAEYADAIGVPRITVLTSIYVIDGKPAAQADLIQALVRMAGHKLRVTTAADGQSATATLIRADDPDFTFTSTWNLERAATAGIAGGQNWRKYPLAMMKARAITEVAREGASEALLGIRYTPEELGADVIDEEGAPVATVAAQAAIAAPARVADDEWTDAIADADTLDRLRDVWERARHQGILGDTLGEGTVGDALKNRAKDFEDSPAEKGGVTEEQTAVIGEWAETLGWNGRALMAHIRSVVGEHVNDILDLTEDEAGRVIVSLKAVSEEAPAEAEPPNPDGQMF